MARHSKLNYNPKADYYQVLGVTSDANAETIQRAYRQKAKEFHPDLNPDREEWAKTRFQLISEAYRVLADKELRQDYNNLRWRFKTFAAGGSAFNWDSATNTPQEEPLWNAPPAPPRRTRRTETSDQWLDDLGLSYFSNFLSGFSRRFGSPYRYILFILATIVVLNIMLVLAGLAFSGGIEFEDDIQVGNKLELTPVPTNTLINGNVIGGTIASNNPNARATPVTSNCSSSATFSIDNLIGLDILRGTINVADMQTYEIKGFFLGSEPSNPPIGEYTFRDRNSAEEIQPILDEELVTLSDKFVLEGYYQIALNVYSSNRQVIEECLITIYWQPLGESN